MEFANRAMHAKGLLATGLLTGFLLATTAAADERAFDKKFVAASGGTLTVETDIGAVDVAGSDSNEIVIHAVISGERHVVEEFEIEADSKGDDVKVTGRRSIDNWFDLSWMHQDLTVRYTIQVPRSYHVQVRNSRGDLTLRNFNGKAYGHTSRGNVSVSGINGEVEIDTSRGDVRGSQLVGNISLVTSRGEITLAKVQGSVTVRSSRGNVDVDLTNPNRGVEVSSSRGNVIVRVPRTFAAELDARTNRGEVECDLPLANKELSSAHRQQALSGTLNGGGKLVKLETSRGNIEIRVGS
jgi:Putative adhesin